MNTEEFSKNLPRKINGVSNLHQHKGNYLDNPQMEIPININAENIGGIINYAISLLDSNEAYLHIGVNCKILGHSIYNQLDKVHYLMSDFSNNPTVRQSIKLWLQKSSYRPYLKIASGNLIKILKNHSYFFAHKIGVCFIDQFSTEDNNTELLQLLESYLADKAIIIINSVNSKIIINTIYSWLENALNAKLIFDLPSSIKTDIIQWENIYIISYERKNGNALFQG